MLGELNTVNNNIIKALKYHNKEKVIDSRFGVVNNASITQNYVLSTLTHYLAALTKEVQSMKKPQNNNHQNTNNTYNKTTSWDELLFWGKLGWQLKYYWTHGSGFHEGRN